jgi:hypothetical protein
MGGFDAIFLSYDEPSADANWLRVLARFPAAHRVHGVRGLHAAHRECARVASTEHFFLIDADSELLPDARLDTATLDVSSPHRAYLWRSRNAVNGLVSGFGGVKLIGREPLAALDSELDLTVSAARFVAVHETASVARFNQSPLHAWRGAFRECARLAGGVLRPHGEAPAVLDHGRSRRGFRRLVPARRAAGRRIRSPPPWRNVQAGTAERLRCARRDVPGDLRVALRCLRARASGTCCGAFPY